jgi:NAD(P)H-hydrate repair Nnr-like enzyme with NAD(P)H-hydrate dehydratase domain
MRTASAALLGAAVVLAGCAKDASQVASTYVSPVIYDNYNCAQLSEEAQRVSSRAAQAAGIQDKKSTSDAVAMGVGLIVVWPALLFIKGNDENTYELARLKGQMDAIEWPDGFFVPAP